MKISITTFWACAEIQYQRAHQLRCIWQNDDESELRATKAFKLWMIQYARVLKLSEIALKLSCPQPPLEHCRSGGMYYHLHRKDEKN